MDLRQIQGLISVQMEKIDDYVIVSPMDGVVLRRDGEIGEIAEAGQILFGSACRSRCAIVAEVNEEDIPRVALGQKALLRTDAFPGQPLEGTVSEITPMGDSGRQDLPHPGRAARRHAAQARHERRGQRRHAREAGRAAGSGRGRAGNRRVRDQWETGPSGARSRSASAVRARSRSLPGCTEGERVAVPFPTALRDGGRVRAIERPR